MVAYLAVVSAAPAAPEDAQIALVRQEQQVNPDGSYQYSWETDNGVVVEEQGALKNVGTEEEALVSSSIIIGTFYYPLPAH